VARIQPDRSRTVRSIVIKHSLAIASAGCPPFPRQLIAQRCRVRAARPDTRVPYRLVQTYIDSTGHTQRLDHGGLPADTSKNRRQTLVETDRCASTTTYQPVDGPDAQGISVGALKARLIRPVQSERTDPNTGVAQLPSKAIDEEARVIDVNRSSPTPTHSPVGHQAPSGPPHRLKGSKSRLRIQH
jgi:hypothetical protein